jgi:hypothetical protein
MTGKPKPHPPQRVTDLITLRQEGAMVTCRTEFEIVPVDFQHRSNPFQAYIFLCRYTGAVDGEDFVFRKCYARGCPHNLCPHVSQAVLIANRYLQRDYHRLERASIGVEKRLFALKEMLVKFDRRWEGSGPPMAIHDYAHLAREGNDITVDPTLEFVAAVEHFDRFENKMVFLMADFCVTCLGRTQHCERCLACYAIDKEQEERMAKATLANERLRLLYADLEAAGVRVEKKYF